MASWREKAHASLVQAIAEADSQGLTGKARDKYITESYPFGGKRATYPYKVWCNERLLLCGPARMRPCPRNAWDLHGMGLLFDANGKVKFRPNEEAH